MAFPNVVMFMPSINKATPFADMSLLITQNNDKGFGGAFVVVPPEGGGEPLETLILDSKQDASQFWSLLQAKASVMIAELEEKKRTQGAFGVRR